DSNARAPSRTSAAAEGRRDFRAAARTLPSHHHPTAPRFRMSTSRILAVTAAVALAGALTAHAQQVSEKANRNPKLITTEEVEAARVNNAYQIIEKLHPEWLRRTARRTTLDGGRPRPPSNSGSSDADGASPASSDANYIQANEPPTTSAVF